MINTFLFSNGSTINLLVKTDLLDNQDEKFTILEISGQTDLTIQKGLPNQQKVSNVQEFKNLAISASVSLKRYKSNNTEIIIVA